MPAHYSCRLPSCEPLHDVLDINKNSSWLSSEESAERRHMGALRYIAATRNTWALKMGLERFTEPPLGSGSSIWPAWESAQRHGIISVAIAASPSLGSWPILEVLVEARANWADCLHWAIHLNQRDLVDKMARKFAGAVVSTGPSWDREMTPLRTGIKSGVDMVKKLLEHGAVPQLSDITFAINSRADSQVVSDLLKVAINGTFPYTNVQLRQIAQVNFNSSGSRNDKIKQWAELLLKADRIELYERAVNRAL